MSICSTLNVTWSFIYFSVCVWVCMQFTPCAIHYIHTTAGNLSAAAAATQLVCSGRVMWRGFPRRRGTTHTHTASCTTILCGELLLCVVKRSLDKISKWKPLTEHINYRGAKYTSNSFICLEIIIYRPIAMAEEYMLNILRIFSRHNYNII